MIKWNKEEHSIGNDIIDNQHKFLFEQIEFIYEAILKDEDIGDVLISTINYCNEHFNEEIKLYLELNADNELIINHLDEHHNISKGLVEFLKKYINGEKIKIDFAIFINRWISDHIINYDIKIFNHLLNKSNK